MNCCLAFNLSDFLTVRLGCSDITVFPDFSSYFGEYEVNMTTKKNMEKTL